MCGIWLLLGLASPVEVPRRCVLQLKARGPETVKMVDLSGAGILGFTRLAINGLNPAGMQPMTNGRLWWMCNGEIYNWKELAAQYSIPTTSGSDCEILGPLYTKIVLEGGQDPATFCRLLDGVFALAIVDIVEKKCVVARDPFGIRPLFLGQRWSMRYQTGASAELYQNGMLFASEIKAMFPMTQGNAPFPPGHVNVYSVPDAKLLSSRRYHVTQWVKNPLLSPATEGGLEMACLSLRTALESAVRKRMMTERPVAALLSGGLDSSLIASLVAKELRKAGAPPLKTFSIGMKGSQDLFYAKKVAEWIGSEHHEIVLTADQFYSAIHSVIRAIETYDTTTVRASVGNWLVSREVARRSDCKVVFNGDGSDEVFGSYLYFYNAPHGAAYEEEVSRLLEEIHMFDVLRSDRCISSHGLEPRTPFLDKQFVSVVRSIATTWLRPLQGRQVEKWLLRRAFDDGATLPSDVLWRRKEAFSDGVSSPEKSWYEVIQERAAEFVPDDWSEKAEIQYPNMTPRTPEQYMYRYYFEAEYGKGNSQTVLPHFWMPRWSPGATDPSARTLPIYAASTATATATATATP